VPGGAPGDLYARSPAAEFRIGASGITLPGAQRTKNFSEGQVMTALTTAKDYLVESSLDPAVLTGGAVRPVRVLLDPDQLEQFDRSMAAPVADGHHSATGWLVRYDPAKVALADPEVRVQGTLTVTEAGPDALEVTSDHTFAYALRPADPHGSRPGGTDQQPGQADRETKKGDGTATGDATTTAEGTESAEGTRTGERSEPGPASLFTVRRELHFRFDRDDLHQHRAELVASSVQAGPQACSDDASGTLRPLLAGQRATAGVPAGTDPYATGDPTAALCGSLAPGAQPKPHKP
ncbi:SCO2583 family membrane protein, partial [Streptomyces sp. NPDC055078]